MSASGVSWGGVNCQAYTQIYWYHPDYLGNTEFVTDAGGYPYQFFFYSAFSRGDCEGKPAGCRSKLAPPSPASAAMRDGESLVQQNAFTGGFATPYKFNAKEQDPETGNYYYGARYYNPQTSIWFGVDPLAHQYPHLTPYNFVEGNPIMLIDPTGMSAIESDDIVVTGVDQGGNKVELYRVVTTAVDVEVETDIQVSEDYKQPESKKLTKEQEQRIKGADAIGVNVSAGVAVKLGAQIDVSYLQVIKGPEKGARGISVGVNGLLGLEGSLDLFHINFYFAPKGKSLTLNDLAGIESGVQGGMTGMGGSIFFGWTIENWEFVRTYTGFSFGASIGVTPADATVYTGLSAFIYENYEKVKK